MVMFISVIGVLRQFFGVSQTLNFPPLTPIGASALRAHSFPAHFDFSASRVIHCDETRVQVLKEPDREPGSQSWMWVQTGGPPNQPMILFDYSTSRAQEVPSRLLEGYRGYLMTDDYAGYNALGAQSGVERLGCWAHARRKFVEA